MENSKNYEITPIGVTNWRNQNIPFGIKDRDRLGHIYVLGKTGVGKSTLLKSMALSDIQMGKGCCIIDPHGDVAEHLLSRIPESRSKDVLYLDLSDNKHIHSFNPLYAVHPEYHSLVTSNLISTFKKIWKDSWGPRLEYFLRYCLITLLKYPYATLLDIQPLLTDKDFRFKVLEYIEDESIHSFWKKEFAKYSPTLLAEIISPILNKMGLFAVSEPLKKMFGQQVSSFRISKILEQEKILIVNLSKGKIGEDISSIVGSILVSSIQLAASYRAKLAENSRKPFYLYIDEAHSFISLSIADILSESRKYGLSLFLAHQYLDQLQEEIKSSIFGNVGTIICFRIGTTDAELLAREFYPTFSQEDFVNLKRFNFYLRLLIDGVSSKPFSAVLTPGMIL